MSAYEAMARIKIGHRLYEVEFTDDPEVLEDNGRWAECSKRKGIIRISTLHRPKDVQAESILHEVLHALMYDTGMDIDADDEERIVTVLALRLAAFMRDNQAVVDDLLRMLS